MGNSGITKIKNNYNISFKGLLLFIFLFLPALVFSQKQGTVKGTILDSLNNTKLANGRVLVLNAKDSILIQYSRVKSDGSFEINNLTAGKFILLVTYPYYADYIDFFNLDSLKRDHDFGKINMITKAKLLAEVIIKGRQAIKINGDTTEFNAEKYVIQPNSKVEDLLKQLPGIVVDKNGSITAQGRAVNKVLVDGEEFFGDDPTLVTRNIRGDMVDKIQLYDKKSDRATFMGIDDGKATKTINVVLKENSKSGYFGKANAGIANSGFYEAQGMINSFKGKRKFAAYVNVGNTGKTGPGFTDGNRFGTVPLTVSTVDGVSGFFDELEGTGRYNGRGIPLARTSGAHYDDKFKEDKQSINTNYRIGDIRTTGRENTISQEILQDKVTYNNSDKTFDNYTFRQKLDVTYQIQFDPTLALKIYADATFKNIESLSNSSASRSLESNMPLTKQSNSLSADGTQKIINSNFLLTKRFKKTRRTLSFSMDQSYSNSVTNRYQNTVDNFYSSAGLDSIRNINQYKALATNNLTTKAGLSYSEPLTQTLTLILNHDLSVNKSYFDRNTFSKSSSGNYDIFENRFSNDLDYKEVANQFGLLFNFRKAKTVINFGLRTYAAKYNQIEKNNNQEFSRSYLNLNPQFSYTYNSSQDQSIRLSYAGNTLQPRMDQLQPILTNEDPLNILTGNPDLGPAYNNRFIVTYNSFKPLSKISFYANASYTFTSNAISNSYLTTTSGQTIIRPINISDKNPGDFSLNVEINKTFPKFQLSLNASTGLNNSFIIVNTILNNRQSINYSYGIRLSKDKLKKYSLSFRVNPSYYSSTQTIQTLKSSNWTIVSGADFTIYLPGKMEIFSDIVYRYTTNNQPLGQIVNPLIWNAGFGKKFLKAENLKLSLTGNNLLNQNPGFTIRPNYQNTFTTIRRYFIVSITWDFSKMGANK